MESQREQPLSGAGKAPWLAAAIEYGGLLAALGLMVLVFGLLGEGFFSRATLLTVANQIPATTIAAVGMTFVLMIGGIDLSVGSVLALSGAVLGVLIKEQHCSVWLAMAAALGAGTLCGLANGLISVTWSLPSFIVTLGMLESARGATHMLTESQTQYLGSVVGWLGELSVGGLSLPFILAFLIVAGGQAVLSFSVFGRYVTAIGANEQAVRYSGIRPNGIKTAVYAISGLTAGIAAVVETVRFQAAGPNAGEGMELQVIAAVVIGGTSLTGGRGSVVRSFLGVLIIAVLGAGLAAVGARDETKRMITGLVIVAAVVLDYYRRGGKSR